MGIKTLTLALHAISGKPVYVRSVDRHARVYVSFKQLSGGMTVPLYEIEFVEDRQCEFEFADGSAAGRRYPIVYDLCKQGHAVVGEFVVDDVFEDEGLVPAV